MFLLACRGTSFKLNTFLSQDFLAAHCFRSSRGKVRTVIAKKMRKTNLRKFDQQMNEYVEVMITC